MTCTFWDISLRALTLGSIFAVARCCPYRAKNPSTNYGALLWPTAVIVHLIGLGTGFDTSRCNGSE